MPRGGKRENSGRKSSWASGCKFKDTQTIRVPKGIAPQLLDLAHQIDAGSRIKIMLENIASFRYQYPQGSLRSELVQFEQGKYIVKVTLRDGETILGSGFGGAGTVEEAEDRARERALDLLVLDPPSTIAPPPEQLPPARGTTSLGEILSAVATQTVGEISPVIESPPTVADTLLGSQSNITTQQKEQERAELRKVETRSPDPEPQKPRLVVVPKPSSPVPSEVIDFSEVLAQTNIEIKRLEWTQQQGREILLERYGKRSRQILTDEELLDFLEYLKSQSAPESVPS